MQLRDVIDAGSDYVYRWPSGDHETYPQWVDYRAVSDDGEHAIRIGFCTRHTYGSDRRRAVVWIDGHPQAEFLGADDFEFSGDLLAEIKVPGDVGERMCRYPDEAIPARYSGMATVGLPTRVDASGVHNAWAVVAHVSDHRLLFALAALRRIERSR